MKTSLWGGGYCRFVSYLLRIMVRSSTRILLVIVSGHISHVCSLETIPETGQPWIVQLMLAVGWQRSLMRNPPKTSFEAGYSGPPVCL